MLRGHLTFHTDAQRIKRKGIAYVVCAVLIPITLYLFFALEALYVVFNPGVFLIFHTFVEILTALVGAAIAYVALAGYVRTGSRIVLLLGTAFLAQAVLDAIHTSVYAGMPNPFIQPGPNQSIYMWLFARLSGSLLLLLSAILPEKETAQGPRTKVLLMALGSVALLAAISTYAVKELIDVLPLMFVPGRGLTGLKIGLETLATVALAVTAIFYLRGYLKFANETVLMFMIGITILTTSEIGFMLYKDVCDIYIALAHVFKLAAFLAFLFALLRAK